jgi:hypothetical protein
MRAYEDHKNSRGVASILVVGFLIFFILAFFAFAIDFAYIYVVRGELQNAADAAALAGAGAIADPGDTVQSEARAAAEEFALKNKASGAPVVLDSTADITVGFWNGTDVEPGVTPVNAVKVVARRVDGLEPARGPVDLFFGGIIGRDTMDITRVAIAEKTPGPTTAMSMCIDTCDLIVPAGPPSGLVLFFRVSEIDDIYKASVGPDLKYGALVNAVNQEINNVCGGLSGKAKKICEDEIKYPGSKIPAFTEFTCTQPSSGLGGNIDEYIRGEKNAPNVCGKCITTTKSQTFLDVVYETYINKRDENGNWTVIAPVVNSTAPGFLCSNCNNLASTTPACSPEGQGSNNEPYFVERYAEFLINGATDETGNPEDFIFEFNGEDYLIEGSDVKGPTLRIGDMKCVDCPAIDLLSQRVQLVK